VYVGEIIIDELKRIINES